MEIMKRQNNEKISNLEKQLKDLENQLIVKEKENKEFRGLVEQSTKEN